MDSSDIKNVLINNNNNNGEHHIPAFIIEEILLRVSSVEDLLIFRTVCKSWKTLMDMEDFKKKHFQTTKRISSTTIILLWNDSIHSEPTLHLLNPRFNNNNNNINKIKIKNININLYQFLYTYEMMALSKGGERLNFIQFGTVNGLVCLGWGAYLYVIFNPSTRKYRVFNAPLGWLFSVFAKSNYLVTSEYIYAFGFDPISQDYKFLMALFQTPTDSAFMDNTSVSYHLYSVNNNSWKWGVVGFPYVKQIVCADGYMDDGKFYFFAHFCGTQFYNPVLIVFDFVKEEFHLMPLPLLFASVHEAVAVANCGYLKMLMSFVHRDDTYQDNEDEDEDEDYLRCEIWRMKDNVGEWTKELSIVFPKEIIGTPLGLTKQGMLVFATSQDFLSNYKEFLLINPDTRSSTLIELNAVHLSTFNFVETFFL